MGRKPTAKSQPAAGALPPPFQSTVGPEHLRFYAKEIAENEKFRMEQYNQLEQLFTKAHGASVTFDMLGEPIEQPLALALRYVEAALLELRHMARTQYLALADLLRQVRDAQPPTAPP